MEYHPDLRDRGKELTQVILGVLMEHELVIEYEANGFGDNLKQVPVKYTIRRRAKRENNGGN